ncbi:hypothetical protein LTR84_002369 [Exophiala bonariae]|uniref:Calpain catalytic domain-containing protein n=1 Tax=Exophiala bonariae TaxID=1690606 RepID=A0AAV9N958_9EURO|nr:hypothetical protein LTR84_002369 [Exophiala bonariae]
MNDDRRDNIGGGRYYGLAADGLPPPAPPKIRRKPRRQTPQAAVDQFWDRLNSRYPGKVFTLLPNNPYARKKAQKTPHGTVTGQRAARSYEEARAECERDVDRIIKECQRLNQKYRDQHFDIEWDLKSGQRNCLDGLSNLGDTMKPKGVKRVTDIFEKPQFYINGPTAGDVRQGRDGDCYLMAALCGLGNMKGLIDKVCVKHDQNIGVYGFVFFRDGEWQHTITDDKLYLRAPDYAEAQDERIVWDDINRVDSEAEYRKAHQTGSRALYFAQCSDENETWLPLLEKAYAKAHGDFASIDGGFTGEAIEDLTGGVTTEIYSTDILDKQAFWDNELMQVGKQFLFGCATGFYSNWLDTSNEPRERDGIAEGHAYSIMDAREINGHKLLKVRNPWGRKEWTGKWSDGSSEWTAEWMQLLDHKFGNDGIFWISYEDLLKNYQHFDRTRIFGSEWNVTQCWTNVNVSWAAEYHSTKFSITLAEKTRVVIVLAQLDDTYFNGLEGGYGYDLQFRLESDAKEDENDYIVRSNGNYAMARSVSTDIELEAGTYSVLMKITATRNPDKDHLEDVVPMYVATRREKLIQMGLSYDLAHAKGVIVETQAERQQRKAKDKIRKAKEREKLKEKMKTDALKHWKKGKERHARDKQRLQRKDRSQAARHGAPFVNGNLRRGQHDDRPTNGTTRNGSLDVQNSDSPKQEKEDRDGLDQDMRVLRIKSFSGEDIIVQRKQKAEDAEKSGDKLVGTSVAQPAPKVLEGTPAESIVEPLEEVVKKADAETTAKTETAQPDTVEHTKDTKSPGQEQPSDETPPTPIVQINGIDAVTDVRPLPNFPPLSQPEDHLPATPGTNEEKTKESEVTQRSDTLDTRTATVGANSGTEPNDTTTQDLPGTINNDHTHVPNDPEVSDADSFPSFDWNTDIDMPSESDSSSSTSSVDARTRLHRRRRYAQHGRRGPGRGGPMRPPINSGLDSPPPGLIEVEHRADGLRGAAGGGDDDGPDEPWNAVCVVGLRVYSTLGGDGVKLRVVRPKNALFDDGTTAPSDVDVDDGGDEDEIDGAHQNLLTLPNGAKKVVVERDATALEDSVILDPDDMARGAVAVIPEATAYSQSEAQAGATGSLKLARGMARPPASGTGFKTNTAPFSPSGGKGNGNGLRKGQRRRL